MANEFYYKYILTLILFSIAFNAKTVFANTSSGHAVYDLLFTNSSYNKNVRPVKEWTTNTIVNASVSVIAIVDFNEVKQTIVLTSKLTLAWVDEYLVWNPSLYENVTHIHTPQSNVWRPSIFLENSVAKQQEFGSSSLKVIITSDGTVTWEPVEVFEATCAADVRKFPFDTQTCYMVFKAMGYTGNEMQLVSVEDHVDFHGNGGTSGWTVTETHMIAETGKDGKTQLLCSLTMSRNPTYFLLNILLPIVILTFMNISVFILPVQSGEKASFVITVFLSLAVFLTIVSSNLPENSDTVSILDVYVFTSTLLSVVIAILTIVQIRIYHKHDSIPVSNVLKMIVFKFTSKARYNNITPIVDFVEEHMSVARVSRRASTVPTNKSVENQSQEKNTKTDAESLPITWSDVARAMDNMFLIIFLTINIIITTATFGLAVWNEELTEETNH